MADDKDEAPESPDIHFEPIVKLAPVEVPTLEDDEEEIIKLRAKLFRYDSATDDHPPEWKERGTGDVKILKHRAHGTYRVLMRRDKTLKVCANHVVLSHMELKPNCGSERAWVWSTPADFADEEAKPELLAIRFANIENAQKFKDKFDLARVEGVDPDDTTGGGDEEESDETDEKATEAGDAATDKVAQKLEELSVKEASSESKTEDKEAER